MNNTSIKYDVVIDICDRINAVVRDLNEQFEKVNSFSNSRSGFWKGTAANKFYNEISKKYKEIPEVTEKTLPLYLETIKEIVEQNRATDTEINAEQIAKLGFSAPTISIPKTGGSNVKIVSGIGKINIKTPNYIGKLKTTDTLVTGIIDLNPSYPIPDKTQKTNTTTTNTNEKVKDLNSIGSNVKQTDKIVDNASHSNSTASGAISLSELLKFIK